MADEILYYQAEGRSSGCGGKSFMRERLIGRKELRCFLEDTVNDRRSCSIILMSTTLEGSTI